MPCKGLHVDCMAQIRVAFALVPQGGLNPQGVLMQLEELLAAEPANSRRAVFELSDKESDAPNSPKGGSRRKTRP